MRKVLPLVLIAAAAALAPKANAYTVLTEVTCAEITAGESDPVASASHTAWILGYMTGRNVVESADSGQDLPDGVMYGMALQFCVDNPDATLEGAAEFVYEGLK